LYTLLTPTIEKMILLGSVTAIGSKNTIAYVRGMTTWKEVLGTTRGRMVALMTFAPLAILILVYGRFLTAVEARKGVRLADPLLSEIPSADLTWQIFLVLYVALLAAILTLAPRPLLLFRAIHCYVLLVLIRMAFMWVTPLDPPDGMIILADPVVESFAGDGGVSLTRDLFFSGHTSILTMMALTARDRRMQWIFGVCAALIAVMVLVQHVHYTIDVLVAPLAAWTAVTLVDRTLYRSR
jgi:hypothetical protein